MLSEEIYRYAVENPTNPISYDGFLTLVRNQSRGISPKLANKIARELGFERIDAKTTTVKLKSILFEDVQKFVRDIAPGASDESAYVLEIFAGYMRELFIMQSSETVVLDSLNRVLVERGVKPEALREAIAYLVRYR